MLHSDSKPNSVWEAIRSRHSYAMDAPEQRYQRHLTTNREIGASIVYWPTMNFEKSLLYREPLRDPSGDLLRDASGNIQTYIPLDNAFAIAYRLGTNVLFKHYLAQYGRAFSVAYNQNRDFRHTMEVGNDLLALSQTAQHLDASPLSLKQEIRAAMQSPVHDMVSHSIAANRLLTNFASGAMEVTPDNIEGLKRELDALAMFAEEKAGSLRGMMAMRTYASHTPSAMPQDLAEFTRPSGFIRDVLKQNRLTSMRQAEILLAFTAGLMAEGAIPLTQEELFIPQDHIYITGSQAVELGRFISDAMRRSGYALNQDPQGRPLVPNVPAGAMLKAHRSANGDTAYVPLNEKEVAAFATGVLGYLKQHFAASMNRMMAYADEHYADVQAVLLDHPKELRSYHDELKTALADSLPATAKHHPANMAGAELTKPWQERVQSRGPLSQLASLPNDIRRHAHLLSDHLTRPEARHEIHKLFSRSLPTYLLNLPISIVSHTLLGFTKRDANWNHIPLTRDNWKKHGVGLVVTPENLKASLFQLMVYPLVESIGSVEFTELANYSRTLAHDATKRMDNVLLAAVKTAGAHDTSLHDGMKQIAERNPAAEVLAEHPEYRKVMQALDGKQALNSAEDYELLAGFYRAVSERVAKDAVPLFSPYLQQGESFADALHKVTHAPVKTVGEAALALSFLHSVAALNEKNIRWIEYLPPEMAQVDYQQLGKLSAYLNDQAVNAGLTVYDPKIMHVEGMTAGELVHRDHATGACRRAQPEEIIRLANVGTQKFREMMSASRLEDITSGRHSDRYLQETEKLLFAPARFAPVHTKEKQEQAPASAAPASTPWNTSHIQLSNQGGDVMAAARYAVRPEALHQMNKLFWRMLFTRLLYTPVNISENLLWRHKIQIDRTAPLATQMSQFFNSNNVRQSMWTVASFPVAFSYGITGLWEFGSYMFGSQRQALEESQISTGYLGAAIRAGAKVDPDLNAHMSLQEGTNPALLALQEKPEFKRLPEIFAKPQDARSAQEQQLTEHFFAQAGDAMMHNANAVLAGEIAAPHGMAQQLERIVTRPATTVAEATRKLAFTQTMIDLNREYAEMMRYFDPEERLIDTKQLAGLASFIHTQALGAGLVVFDPKKPPRTGVPQDAKAGDLLERTADGVLKPISAESLIRFANVVGDKLTKTVDARNMDKALHGALSAQYLDATDRNTSNAL